MRKLYRYYDRALAIDPSDVDTLDSKGFALYNLGRTDEAIGLFDKVLTINSNDTDALVNKGLALDDLDRSEEAIQVLRQSLSNRS